MCIRFAKLIFVILYRKRPSFLCNLPKRLWHQKKRTQNKGVGVAADPRLGTYFAFFGYAITPFTKLALPLDHL